MCDNVLFLIAVISVFQGLLMTRRFFRFFRLASAGLFVFFACGFVFAQTSSGPINLDQALREDSPPEPDRAASYYHYALAKWHEANGDAARALTEMRNALETNPASSAIHYELAALYAQIGNIQEATRYANESIKLDSENPDPHWLLMNIHLDSQARRSGGAPAGRAGLRPALRELEILEKLTPEDERVYYMLGGIYLELGEVDNAVRAYEKYQKYSGSDNGYREIARYYASINDFDTAAEYLNKGLELYPDSAESLMMLGSVYLSQGKNREGAAAYRKLFEISGANPQIMRRLAVTLFEAKEYREAAQMLEELAKSGANPDRLSQVILGQSYFEMNRYSDAIRIFNEVLLRAPDDVDARFYLGESYSRRGRYEDAIKLYEDLLRDRDPRAIENRSVFRERLAGALLELEDYERAIDLYEENAEVNPEDRYRLTLLEAYRVSEQYDKGLARCKEFMAAKPDDIDFNAIYARILADADKKKEAIGILSEMLQSNPEVISLYVNLSEIYRQDKRYSDAERILLRAEERNKDPELGERLRFQRAAIYEQQKSFDRAEQLFKEILEKQPDNIMALNYLGYMLADRNVRLDEAIGYIRKALEIDPENGAYLDSLGWAYFRLDDMENAEKYLLEAAGIVPKDPTIQDHLGDLYFNTGQFEKAREYWEKTISISKDQEEIKRVRGKLKQIENTLRGKPSRR
ncbi:MAG: tetratricopeptide repeat protein [Acidobacteriota bacterium]|nr:tetratricopeptide repeat protein [Acidobacteriota bacterium]